MAESQQVKGSEEEKEMEDNSILNLESGTSLAEWEHSDDKAPLVDSNERIVTTTKESIESLRSLISSDVLTGSRSVETFTSPFEDPTSASKFKGKNLSVPLVYCDQTASNRPVRSIEQYMAQTCLPLYGNTHTNTSITGSQSTAFVAEARQIVAEATNAKITGKASLDVVLFAGNGTTSAVELLIDCLGIKHAGATASADKDEKSQRPVVFIGPYEHHSNLLPWRESGCEIVMVPECQRTRTVDMKALETLLMSPQYAKRIKMGTFTVASNVTGKVCNVDEIASMLHRHGALAFFDYATGAPYLPINMNPPPSESYPSAALVAKDAVFLSPHKMLGGVGTPGVLIVKKHLVQQMNPPQRSGGGTVFYVTNNHHRFLSNRIERNEGGTPNIAGIIRTGLTFLLKRQAEARYAVLQTDIVKDGREATTPSTLLDHDYQIYKHVVHTLKERAPNLILLGRGSDQNEGDQQHLPIFSFLIQCGSRFLHYNYVCAILNDVFGIQSRGGCQCSGPYSQRLLGLTTVTADGEEVPNEQNALIEQALVHCKERAELLRPGYTRLSLPFKGLCNEEVSYAVKALEWVAKHGWALMCQYRCNHRTGEWRHFSRQGKPLGRTERKWLSHYDLLGERNKREVDRSPGKGVDLKTMLDETLANADKLLKAARTDQSNVSQALNMNDANSMLGTDDDSLEKLRWYIYPKECARWLSEGLRSVPADDSDSAVLGAIQPLALGRKTVIRDGDGSRPNHIARSDVNGGKLPPDNRKRKKPVDCVGRSSDSVAPSHHATECVSTAGEGTTSYAGDVFVHDPEKPSLLFFRDGEHTGEVLLEDIEVGLEEGELSDHCEVFDQASDSWVSISDFLLSRKKKRTAQDGSEIKAAPATGKEQDVSQTTQTNGMTDQGTMNVEEVKKRESAPTVDAVNNRKKPPRDSSTWGRASLVTLQGTPSKPVDVDKRTGDAIQDVDPTWDLNIETIVPHDYDDSKRNRKSRGVKPPAKIMRYITQAMMQWSMVEEGDRLLLGLSGGKDSLSLLHCLLEFQRKSRVKFTIEVCTIDPMTPSFDPSPLIPYVESLGLKYHYIRDDIVSRASTSGKDGKVVSSLCAFCARMKRGNLYTCARRNNCNKLVLAQHLDDCAESFLMSIMHNGFLRTMKANYRINAGDISVIRPMVYCREGLMTDFAKTANLPVINENCPACFEEPKERARVKKLLSREETLYPNTYDNIRRSLIPLLHEDATAILRCYTEEAVSKSRKVGKNSNKEKGSKTGKKNSKSNAESKKESKQMPSQAPLPTTNQNSCNKLLSEADEEELIVELARRKAERFRLSGAMGRLEQGGDPTGQVCTLNGENGSIPCRELME